MDGFLELFSTYLGPFANPALLVAAAVAVCLLTTGLGAKLVEVGEAAGDRLASRSARRSTPQRLVE